MTTQLNTRHGSVPSPNARKADRALTELLTRGLQESSEVLEISLWLGTGDIAVAIWANDAAAAFAADDALHAVRVAAGHAAVVDSLTVAGCSTRTPLAALGYTGGNTVPANDALTAAVLFAHLRVLAVVVVDHEALIVGRRAATMHAACPRLRAMVLILGDTANKSVVAAQTIEVAAHGASAALTRGFTSRGAQNEAEQDAGSYETHDESCELLEPSRCANV
jgi:hypothetical protein